MKLQLHLMEVPIKTSPRATTERMMNTESFFTMAAAPCAILTVTNINNSLVQFSVLNQYIFPSYSVYGRPHILFLKYLWGLNKCFLKLMIHNFSERSGCIVSSGFTRDTATLTQFSSLPSDICLHLAGVFWNTVSLSPGV